MSETVKSGPTRLAWATYALATAVIVLDQLSKFWMLNVYALAERGSVPVLPFFNLTMVWNRGVSFGFLRADADLARWGLAAFSIAVAIGLAIWAKRVAEPLRAVALGLVIGGALGNVIDRIRFGAVADFLDFSGLHFPWVFNVADSAITVGVILLLLESLLTKPQPQP
ncbi:MAG: signal peptidase II [Caulobacteraceae bacterium]